MRPLLVLVTIFLLSGHVLGGEPKGEEEDGGDGDESDDEDEDDEEDEEVVSPSKPCNTACILIFQPVCAINSKLVLKTFSNSCFLGIFNCQNREDFVAVANCSCIADGVALTASTPVLPTKDKKKNKEEENEEEDD